MEQKAFDILCIGTAIVDSIIRGFDPNPVSETGFTAASGTLAAGGEAVNASVTAAKLGMQTAILSYVGEDSAGDLLEQFLTKNGVDTSLLIRKKDHPTPVTTMFVAEDGSRKSVTNLAHRFSFEPERYLSNLDAARAVILGSLFRAPFQDSEGTLKLVKAAKDRGILVAADTKLPNFWKLSLSDFRDVLPWIDYITPNEQEARLYAGETEPEKMADVFLGYGVKNVIIKLGAEGCLFKNSRTSLRLPAENVRAVDATGAGDNFIAGFVSELLRGKTEEEALRFANACGAICSTAVGAGTALRNREQVLTFLKLRS